MNHNYYFLLALVIGLFGFLTGLAQESFATKIVLVHFGLAGILFFVATIKGLLNFKKERTKFLRVSLNILLVTLIFVGLSIWQSWLSQKKITWDLSKQIVYSLTSESQALLVKVKKPLNLFFIDDFNPTTRQEDDRLLGLYDKANPLISYRMVDPRKAKQLRPYLDPQEVSFLYFEYGEGKDALVGKTKTFTEVEISKAIFRLISGPQGKIYYAFGHGEPSPELEDESGLSEMMTALQSQNFELHGLILGSGKVPPDAKLLILASGSKAYLPNEEQILQDYLANGGNLLVLDDPENQINFNTLINPYGIKIEKAVVIDQQRLLHDGPEIGWQIIVNDFADHPATKSLKDRKAAIFLVASLLSSVESQKSGEVVPLLRSSGTAWGETDLEILNLEEPKAQFEPKTDFLGPVTLAMSFQGSVPVKQTQKDQRIVVFSDLEWLVNANLDIYANKELLIKTVNWLVGDQEELEINSRFLESTSMMPIRKSDYQKVFILALLIPEILLILLLSISYRRKNS